jgi:hypothetical protein
MTSTATLGSEVMMSPATSREQPILFSGPMVRAILDGTKTQTRRVMKPQPTYHRVAGQTMIGHPELAGQFGDHIFGACAARLIPCPYGAPGDRLWVREQWAIGLAALPTGAGFVPFTGPLGKPFKEADPRPTSPRAKLIYGASWDGNDRPPFRSPIHMPRWASRLTLEITDVRVQRVQEMDWRDALAEGVDVELCKHYGAGAHGCTDCMGSGITEDPVPAFAALWDLLNAKRGHGWDTNPWVWALTFRRLA